MAVIVYFVGGPAGGTSDFLTGPLPKTLTRQGVVYRQDPPGGTLYVWAERRPTDVYKAWSRFMHALAHRVPRAVNRSAAARARTRRLLK